MKLSLQIFENTKISNFTNIFQVGTELLHAGGRTDMMKLIVAFRNFSNAQKRVNYVRNVAICGTRDNTSLGGYDE